MSFAIRKFQIFAHLPPTGDLDEETTAQMSKPRCGVADFDRLKKDGSGSQKWYKNTLTWTIDAYTYDMDHGATRSAISEAFNVWQSVIPIDFIEVSPRVGEVDIRIRFASRSHDDAWPFDGPGRVLAHAMYPPDGRCHFDDDEHWVYRDPARAREYEHTDLLHVAVHELGHALGLGHSRQQAAVMAPFYSSGDGSFQLHTDDIRAIQALYANGGVRYAFAGVDIWQLDAQLRVVRRQRLADVFEGPRTVDAAVTNPRSQVTVLFEGRRVWAYLWSVADSKFQLQSGFPKQLSEQIRFAPEAAFLWRDGNIVLTHRDNFAIYDENWNAATIVERISSYFPAYPTSGVRATLAVSSGTVHIFTADGDVEYDTRNGGVRTATSVQCR